MDFGFKYTTLSETLGTEEKATTAPTAKQDKATSAPPAKERLLSLDIVRGLTVVIMYVQGSRSGTDR